MGEKGMNYGIALVIASIIALVGFGVYYFYSRENAEQPIPKMPETMPKLEFTIVSCSEINENFECASSNAFMAGDKVHFLINAKNVKVADKNGAYYFEIELARQLKNLDYYKIAIGFEEPPEIIKRNTNLTGFVDVPIAKSLTTSQSDIRGIYEYTVKLKDKNSGQEYLQKAEFVLA